ncbi:MAG: hypothetical protein H6505_02645 [Calditrichaeota bacterium]|nr:hypothetical protein [Calditrichota bacterium]
MLLLMPVVSFSMIQESGTLDGFLLDTCATCAYDNWVSHVSEGIARPGYNDYGPSHLDPQTNGFGGFTLIPDNPEGDSTLARWRAIFEHCVAEEWQSADSLLALRDSVWRYEMVEFHDSTLVRDFYILRERLDSVFVDLNGDTVAANNVTGGFRTGWGVFIFSPGGRHDRAIMQLPHPEDDFLSIPVGIAMFQELEMAVLMIAGAGREVLWDTSRPQYTNTYSFSDPTRNGRHPFGELSRVLTDHWNEPPVSPMVIIQLHSYDHGSHGPLSDIQITAYHDDAKPNLPLRDLAYGRDLIRAHPLYPVAVVDGDTNITCIVNHYLGLYSSPVYSYVNDDTVVAIPSLQDLLGAPDNVEAVYAHVGHDVDIHTENFLHVELDEYPDALWLPPDWLRWLPSAAPATSEMFVHVLDYYRPFIVAMDSALTWHAEPDTLAPLPIELTDVYDPGDGTVRLTWNQAALDPHFDTYQIFYDANGVTPESPSVTRTSTGYALLGDMHLTTITLTTVHPPIWAFEFAIRAQDALGQMTPMSEPLGVTSGYIPDVCATVESDTLTLHWSALPIDSVYEIREYFQDTQDYYYIATTADTTYAFVPMTQSGYVYHYKVKRIVRR